MKNSQQKLRESSTIHSQTTDPLLRSVTAPIPTVYLPQQSRAQRFWHAVGQFFAAIVRKINQLLGLALLVTLLLLITRLVLHFFEITTSIFASWVFFITAPIVYPFDNLAPALPYNGFSIDITTLVAIVVWTVIVMIVRQFLRVLVGRAY